MNSNGEKLGAPTYFEAAAAAKLRALPVPASWAEIESAARLLAVQSSEQSFEMRARCADLVAAARALDKRRAGRARRRRHRARARFVDGGDLRGERQFSQRGRRRSSHFSARVGAPDEATATLLCALAPALRFKLRAQTRSPVRSTRYWRANHPTFLPCSMRSKTPTTRRNSGNWRAPVWTPPRKGRRCPHWRTRSCPPDSRRN